MASHVEGGASVASSEGKVPRKIFIHRRN